VPAGWSGAIDAEPRTVSQIARAMGLTRRRVQRTADRPQMEDIVTSVDNPAHRRAKLVGLTARSRSVLDGIPQRQSCGPTTSARARSGEADVRRALRVIHAFREILEHTDRPERTGRTGGRPAADRGPFPRQTRESTR
jgi:DNA-binding MarR family transcriptional regulator